MFSRPDDQVFARSTRSNISSSCRTGLPCEAILLDRLGRQLGVIGVLLHEPRSLSISSPTAFGGLVSLSSTTFTSMNASPCDRPGFPHDVFVVTVGQPAAPSVIHKYWHRDVGEDLLRILEKDVRTGCAPISIASGQRGRSPSD